LVVVVVVVVMDPIKVEALVDLGVVVDTIAEQLVMEQ
jgi:hypothetical protein